MSTHVQATGYTLKAGLPVAFLVDEVVFGYPTGTLSVSPPTGDSNTNFLISIAAATDPAATPAKTEYQIDAGPWTLTAPSATHFSVGTHVIKGKVTDHNGAISNTNQVNLNVFAPAPVPAPTTKTIWGSSGGAWGTATMVSKVHPKIIRCFSPSQTTGVPAGIPIVYSNDGGHNRGYDLDGATVGSAGYAAWLKELSANLRDDAVHYVCWGHEEDIHGDDAVKLGRVYDGGRLVINTLNATRKFKIKTAVITTGMPYDDTTASGYKKWNLKNADVIAFDNYARKHWDTITAWALQCGKPWGVGENGIQAQTDPNKYTDVQIKEAMIADHDKAIAGKAEFFCYWPQGGNDLTNKPLSTAQLAAYCAA